MLKFTNTEIKDVYIIEPQVFEDNRGYFMETYSQKDFAIKGLNYHFVQNNQSKSKKGVLRGLHFQTNHPQAKLVRVIKGKVFDVAVDLRKNSVTYGKWVGVELSAQNKKQLLIPRGFAHGFLVMEDDTEFVYQCDELYYSNEDGGIIYNDPDINITWPKLDIEFILADKDKNRPTLKQAKVEFNL